MVLLISKNVFQSNPGGRSIVLIYYSYLPALRPLSGVAFDKVIALTDDPHEMFEQMPRRDYKSCNVLIRTHAAKNRYLEAISVFQCLQRASLRPDRFALAAVMKGSGLLSNEVLGKALHGSAVKGGYGGHLTVEKALMDMYARFGLLDDSCQIFKSMSRQDSVSWNVMLAGYSRAQLYIEAMDMLYMMHVSCGIEVKPSAITIAIILPICAKVKLLKHGQCLHSYTIKRGMESETLVGNALLSMYAKCGRVIDGACVVFDMISCKDVISWNSMIAGFSENGFFAEALDLFYQMVSMDFMPNDATIISILPICGLLKNGWLYGQEIHAYALRFEFDKDICVCNALLNHYLKVGNIVRAEYIFQKMQRRDIVSWNTLISGYAINGWFSEAMNLFHNLLQSNMKPDLATLISILPCCAQLLELSEGRKIHDYILQHASLSQETSLGNALVSFYGKCGKLDEAVQCFDGLFAKDLISWNAMLTVFADNGQWKKFIKLLNEMHHEQIKPDFITITTILRACTSRGIMKVKQVHGYSFRSGLISHPNVIKTILAAYANCWRMDCSTKTSEDLTEGTVSSDNAMILDHLRHGSLEHAEKIFNQMSERDPTIWNLMLQVYVCNDCFDRAFALFRELQENEGMKPDIVSIMCILTACSRLALVSFVKQCHGYSIRASIDDQHLGAALLDTYSKCGIIKDACKQFQTILSKDLITFTAMIQGYAIHGMAEEALQTFSRMLELDIKPDHVILTALLSACSHTGLIDEGWKHFTSIKRMHGIEPTREHYACMVDLLSRKGHLKEAHDFIKDMPCKANANIWGSLLGSCKVHGEVDIGRIAADHLLGVEGWNVGNYVVMSNIYAAEGSWNGVEQVRRLMKNKDMRKPAGCSWIEVEGKNNIFVATDLCHPQRHLIYSTLRSLDQHLKHSFNQQKAIRLCLV